MMETSFMQFKPAQLYTQNPLFCNFANGILSRV